MGQCKSDRVLSNLLSDIFMGNEMIPGNKLGLAKPLPMGNEMIPSNKLGLAKPIAVGNKMIPGNKQRWAKPLPRGKSAQGIPINDAT